MIAERFDAFLLDLDGVVYLGEQPLPGVGETLARLRGANKRIRFLTNDPRPTRMQLLRRLIGMNIAACDEEIVTSGWATARYLRDQKIKSAYVVGSHGLATEILGAGIEVVDRGPCEAVVIGCDEYVTYSHIREATRLIFNGARFIATNADSSFPSPKGPLPGTGAIVAAVRVSTGQEPIVIGKPFSAMFDIALQRLGVERARTVMVGDTLDSDIEGAVRAGIAGVLVQRNGEKVVFPKERVVADAVISNLSELFDLSEFAHG